MVVLGARLFHIFINSLKDRTERKMGQCDTGRSSQYTGGQDCYPDGQMHSKLEVQQRQMHSRLNKPLYQHTDGCQLVI